MKKTLLLLLFTTTVFSQITNSKYKKIYFFGDSITYGAGVTASQSYPTIVANSLGMEKVNFAIKGTCMMYQSPACKVDCRHMEYRVDKNDVPIFNPETDALLFVSYLTNDVGINLPNYTIENFGKAIDKIIQGLYKAGWNKNNIKFNVRYYIENAGLAKYPSNLYGWFTPATIERYNAFAELLRNKLDEQGIQYFDHYNTLNAVEFAYSHLPDKVHPDAYFHSLIAKNIIDTIKIENTLSTVTFELDNSFTNVEYYNLLGQKIKDPIKGIYILKAEKNNKIYIKKMYGKTN